MARPIPRSEQGAQVSDTPIFNEDALERAIHACWGKHGAHAEVYAMLRKELAAARRDAEELRGAFQAVLLQLDPPTPEKGGE